MTRALDYFQSQAIDRGITEPRYLVRLALSETLYLSTNGDLAYDGHLWVEGSIAQESLRYGEQSASLTLSNPGGIYTPGALRGDYQYRAFDVFLAYPYVGDPPDYFPPGYIDFDEGDYVGQSDTVTVISLFSGFISDFPTIGDWIEIAASRTSERRYPSRKNRPPFANHIPADGTVIVWNGVPLKVQA